MPVVERLARRESDWHELERLLDRWDGPRAARPGAVDLIRLGELYRDACADLMRAEAHDLPRETVAYLHSLVGRAHNVIYRGRGFRFSDAFRAVFEQAPRRLRADPALRIAALAFYGVFLIFALLAAGRPGFAREVSGEAYLGQMEEMYSTPLAERASGGMQGRNDSAMTGFYIYHNAGIGLQCFAWGIAAGLGTLYTLVSNAVSLGVAFGHMATTPQAANFYEFVTAHGPFELTAIVFSGAAGLRMGYGLIDTKGRSRLASLKRSAHDALPAAGAAVVLFILAAFLEGFVSASAMPYSSKAGIALGSAALLLAYLMLGGRTAQHEGAP
jgi:uncharacterized membrane protein SpoIIM required for sporulation